MINGWQILVSLGDCTELYEVTANEDDLVFLPNKGDLFFVTDGCRDKLDDFARECWERNKDKCGQCPYLYGRKGEEKHIDTSDANTVKDIVHDVGEKTIEIVLSK